jgi:transcriptional regulator with XRE-family HTH domain
MARRFRLCFTVFTNYCQERIVPYLRIVKYRDACMGQQKGTLDRREPGVAALGDFLRARREKAGLSMTQMAERLGISRPQLGRLERGESEHPTPTTLSKIARCLDVPLEDLYALAGVMLPTDLPDLCPYLHAKHPDWPNLVITELDDYCDFLKRKYSLR